MKKGWTITKLIAAGSLGVIALILALIGAGVVASTGIPLTGLTNAVVVPTIVITCLLVVDKVGATTVMLALLGLLQLPLPLVGPPGFLLKVPIQLLGGVIADGVYLLLRRKRLFACLLIGSLNDLYIGIITVEAMRFFDVPGVEQAAKLVYSFPAIVGAVILGALGGYLGYLIYQKIKNTAVVRRIQE